MGTLPLLYFILVGDFNDTFRELRD